MATKKTGLNSSVTDLVIENLFSLNNGKEKPSVSQIYTEKKINSLYGTVGLNYDGWAFLDATFRNDWSSALAKEHRSFFYPSVSASVLFVDMLNKYKVAMPKWFTFGKLRASYAEVGNDMDPYQLYNLYYRNNVSNYCWGWYYTPSSIYLVGTILLSAYYLFNE